MLKDFLVAHHCPNVSRHAAFNICVRELRKGWRVHSAALYLHSFGVLVRIRGLVIERLDKPECMSDEEINCRSALQSALDMQAVHAGLSYVLMSLTRFAACGSFMRSRNSANDRACVASASWLSSAMMTTQLNDLGVLRTARWGATLVRCKPCNAFRSTSKLTNDLHAQLQVSTTHFICPPIVLAATAALNLRTFWQKLQLPRLTHGSGRLFLCTCRSASTLR